MVTDLRHQSRRGLPREWVASKSAVHEDCDLVNMFLSLFDISTPLLGFPQDTALHVATGQGRIHEARSFSGPNVSLFQHDPLCLGPIMKVSYKQNCIVLLHLSSESDSVFRLTSCSFLSWCARCLNVRFASRFTDDEWAYLKENQSLGWRSL